jgi:hypothetical protein
LFPPKEYGKALEQTETSEVAETEVAPTPITALALDVQPRPSVTVKFQEPDPRSNVPAPENGATPPVLDTTTETVPPQSATAGAEAEAVRTVPSPVTEEVAPEVTVEPVPSVQVASFHLVTARSRNPDPDVLIVRPSSAQPQATELVTLKRPILRGVVPMGAPGQKLPVLED